MRTAIASLALLTAAFVTPAAEAAPDGQQLRALYARFLVAQNARDLQQVRAVLWDSPHFLWVSDGMSFWGPDALIQRMSQFQEAEVWRVDPDLARAVAVEVGEHTGYLHLPLVLTIGPSAQPDRLRFLVSMLGVETPQGWRIAALFTTTEKPR